MAQQRESRFNEIIGVMLIAAGLLISISLISYHSDDPSLTHSLVADWDKKNWAGVVGAYLSDGLFQLFGGGPYIFPFFAFLFGFKKILDIKSRRFYLELTGAHYLSVFPYSLFNNHIRQDTHILWRPYPFRRPAQRYNLPYLLLKSLARPGAYIIVIALGIISLIISTNISLIQIFMWFWDALNAYDRVKTEKIIKEKKQEKRWKEEDYPREGYI